MNYRAVLFDLDGTLLDTLDDIAESAESVLRQFGFPTHGVDAYRRFVGDGVWSLFERALPAGKAEPERIESLAKAFRVAYERTWNRSTKLYEGISELLDALKARSMKTAVLSNKPDYFVQLCVEKYFAGRDFPVVFGQREGIPRKPDPAGAREVAERLGLLPQQFIYLGDTPTDIQTARSAGMLPVGVAWGFRPVEELEAAGAEWLLEFPMQLLDRIDNA